MTDPRRALRLAIKRSGLSKRKYAEQVLLRDERTIRRWLAGETAIPALIVRKLTEKPQPSL